MNNTHGRTAFIEAITQEEALLARLDEERQVVSERLRHLRTQLATLEPMATSSIEPSSHPLTKRFPCSALVRMKNLGLGVT